MSDVWVERIKAIGAAATAVLAAVGVLVGTWNNSKLSAVQSHQEVNTQRIEDTQKKVEQVHETVTAMQ